MPPDENEVIKQAEGLVTKADRERNARELGATIAAFNRGLINGGVARDTAQILTVYYQQWILAQ